MCPIRSSFMSYSPTTYLASLFTTVQAPDIRIGTILMTVLLAIRSVPVQLDEVLYIAAIHSKLISVPSMTSLPLEAYFTDYECKIVSSGRTVATGTRSAQLYYLDISSSTSIYSSPDQYSSPAQTSALTTTTDLTFWHDPLAHIYPSVISCMVALKFLQYISISLSSCLPTPCEGYVYDKRHCMTFPQCSSSTTYSVLELINTDMLGPISTPISRTQYFAYFIDDFSRKIWVYPMHRKLDTFGLIISLQAFAEILTGNTISRLRLHDTQATAAPTVRIFRIDNGGEYIPSKFRNHHLTRGILHHPTAPYSPQQNCVTERLNRMLGNNLHAMLHHRRLSKQFWAQALATTVHVCNRLYTHVLPDDLRPNHHWDSTSPDVSHLR